MESRVFDYIAREQARQNATVELIASENFVSDAVLRAVGSCLTNKYAEGYPAERVSSNKGRYYGGCEVVNDLEEYCCAMWKKVFRTDYHVNVQPHSGANANLAAYMSVLQPGDTILAMSLNNGGYLTHGSSVNFSGKLFDMKFYDVDDQGFIDFADVERKAAEYKPRLILAGASAYSRVIDFARFAELTFAARRRNGASVFVYAERDKRVVYDVLVEYVHSNPSRTRFYGVKDARFVCYAKENRNVFGRFFESFEKFVLRLRVHLVRTVYEVNFVSRKRFDRHGVKHLLDVVNLDFVFGGEDVVYVGVVVVKHLSAL